MSNFILYHYESRFLKCLFLLTGGHTSRKRQHGNTAEKADRSLSVCLITPGCRRQEDGSDVLLYQPRRSPVSRNSPVTLSLPLLLCAQRGDVFMLHKGQFSSLLEDHFFSRIFRKETSAVHSLLQSLSASHSFPGVVLSQHLPLRTSRWKQSWGSCGPHVLLCPLQHPVEGGLSVQGISSGPEELMT